MANSTDMVLTDSVSTISGILEPFFTRIMVAIVIILIGFIIARLLGKTVQRILHELEVNAVVKRAVGIRISLEEIIGSFVRYFAYFMTLVMALDQLGLKTYVLNIISAAIIIIIVISVLLSIKDLIPNVISGLILHRKGFIKEGDRIRLDDVEGKIVHINLVETKIRTKEKDIISLPNSMLTKGKLMKLNS
ncbi:MAG: mechanosensitive ion channel domain-containing protein [archaeon]